MSDPIKHTGNTMFYGAKRIIFEYAKELRRNPTHAEQVLWNHLKKKQTGVKFRRQHPINKYIADFYCHELKLVIEVDGGYHKHKDQKEYDNFRTEDMLEFDIEIIRFTNDQIEKDINSVIEKIMFTISRLTSNP